MKVAIVGSKSITNEDLVIKFIEDNYKFNSNDIIISGGVQGVDAIVEQYAKEHHIKTKIYPPEWDKYGPKANFIRNADIISYADLCLIIWDGISKGTKHDIILCEELNKEYKLLNLSKNK